MSLWSHKIPNKKTTKTLLLRVLNCLFVSLKKSLMKNLISGTSPKETSFFISASLTVEAALSLPIFIIFCAGLLSMFSVLGEQIVSSYELELRSQREAMYAEVLPEYDSNIVSVSAYTDSYLFVPEQIAEADIMFTATRRAWTGRILVSEEGSEEEAQTYVYVAENASVYHVSAKCTHLKLSIKQTSFSALSYLRNESGSSYKPCEKCCGEQIPSDVYITSEGDKYHCSSACSGLKRVYELVPLTECDLPACSRCAGNGYD